MDGAGAAGAGEDDGVVLGGVDGVAHRVPRLVPEHGRLHGGHRRRRVRVGVEGQHLGADEVLDEGERAARRHVVAVNDGADAVRAGEGGVGADQAGPDQARYFGPRSP